MWHKINVSQVLGAALLFGVGLSAPRALCAEAGLGDTLALSKLSKRHGFVAYTTEGKRLTLKTRFSTFNFEGDTRKAEFNNTLIWLNAPVSRHWGSWTISEIDVPKTILPLLNPSGALRSENARLVVLDPGHGGGDPGAIEPRRGLEEKQLTLELAERVKTILRKYGIDARLTRSSDQTLELDERCQMANRWGADLFVSIHLNTAANSGSSGIETHILPPAGCPITASSFVGSRDKAAFAGNHHDQANMVLGYQLQRSLLKYTRAEDRGVRRSRFYVIRNVNCPAALVECGFISNHSEKNKIMTAAYRDNVARGIAEGITTYLNLVKQARPRKP